MSMVTETSGLFSSIIGSNGKKGKKGSNLFASLFSGSGAANLAGSATTGKNFRIKVDGLGASQTASTDKSGRLFKQTGKRTQLLQHLSEKLGLKPGDLSGLKAEDLDPETLKKLNALINRLKHAAADKAPGQGAMVNGILNPSGELDLEDMLKKLSEVVGALDAKKTSGAEAADAGALAAMQLFFKDPKTGEMVELKGEKGKEILAGLLAKGGKEAAKSLFVKDPKSGGFTSLENLPQKFKQALIEAKPQLAALFNPETEADAEGDATLDPKAAAKKAKAKTGDASHQKTTSDSEAKPTGSRADQTKAATTQPTQATKEAVHIDGKAQSKVTVTAPSTGGEQTTITAIPVNKGTEGPLLDLDQIVAKIGRTKIKAAHAAGSQGKNQAGSTGKTSGLGEADAAGKSGKTNIKSTATEGLPPARNTGPRSTGATTAKVASHPFGSATLDPMEQLLAKEPGLFDKVDLKGMMREFKVQKADSQTASDAPTTYHAAKLKARANAAQEDRKQGVHVPKVHAETKDPKAPNPREANRRHTADHEQNTGPVKVETKTAKAGLDQGATRWSAKNAASKPATDPAQAKHEDGIPTKAVGEKAVTEKADGPNKVTEKPTGATPQRQDPSKTAPPSTEPRVAHQATKTAVETQARREDRAPEIRQEPTQTRISDQTEKGSAGKDAGTREQRRDTPAKGQATPTPTRTNRADEAKSQTFATSVEAKTPEEPQTQNPSRSDLRSKPSGAGRAAERATPSHMTATEKAALDRPAGAAEPAAKMATTGGEEANKGRVESILKRPVNVAARAAQPTRGPQQGAVQNETPRADVPAQAAEVKTEAAVKPMARPTQAPPQPMFRQVQDGVYQAWQVRPNQVTIKLSPDELGELKIEVSQEQDKIKAKIQTESHKVTTIIKDHQSELEHRLREQGVEFKSFDVYEQAGQGQHENARREAPGERAEHANGGGRTTGGGTEEGTETTASAPVQDYTVEAGRPFSFTV